VPSTPPLRPRGRPRGGGNSAEQARTLLMDAAERSFLSRGFQASRMDLIAREAGYSRAAMYRHFPNRRRLLEAMVRRTTLRYQQSIGDRLPRGAGLPEIVSESLVIVATELIHDPLLKTISEEAEEGLVAKLVADNPDLPLMIEAMLAHDDDGQLRSGVQPGDVGQFIVSTAVALLLGVVPGTAHPDTARRYIETFVLPAIFAQPPPPRAVFPERPR
jgi:AcrR family transcriptional regulator